MPAQPRWMILFLLLATTCLGQEPKSVTQVEVSEHLIKASIYTSMIYPPLARQARIQGKVELILFINESGEVTDVRVDKGNPMLRGAAEKTAKQLKFRPFIEDDEAIPVSGPFIINFHIEGTDRPEEVEFKRDFEKELQAARESLQNGALSASLGLGSAEQALKLARDANHAHEAAQAQLLIARLNDLQGVPSTADFDTALNLFREVVSNGQLSERSAEWAEANFIAGSYFFHSKDFVRARPVLDQSLRNWLSDPNASGEIRAMIARTAAMLATANLELKRIPAAESNCRIFKREKRALHGLELDEASQACSWTR
jgi:TonB family protein